MKNLIYSAGFLLLIFISCQKDKNEIPEDPKFSIQFSDGTIIGEDDISFYDSSTCILFLKERLSLQFVLGESPNIQFTGFSVKVDEDTIYDGIIYPDLYSAMSPVPYYISSINVPIFDGDMIPFKFFDYYTNESDERNNEKIIEALEKKSLLRNGLTCTINSVIPSSQNDSVLIYAFTIKNHDDTDYYILDPQKMGIDHFNYYTNGLRIKQKETNEHYYAQYSNSTIEWEGVEMEDLSLINAHDAVTFVVESTYSSAFEDGEYECKLNYGNLMRLYSFDLPLDQTDGRVWIGSASSTKDVSISN